MADIDRSASKLVLVLGLKGSGKSVFINEIAGKCMSICRPKKPDTNQRGVLSIGMHRTLVVKDQLQPLETADTPSNGVVYIEGPAADGTQPDSAGLDDLKKSVKGFKSGIVVVVFDAPEKKLNKEDQDIIKQAMSLNLNGHFRYFAIINKVTSEHRSDRDIHDLTKVAQEQLKPKPGTNITWKVLPMFLDDALAGYGLICDGNSTTFYRPDRTEIILNQGQEYEPYHTKTWPDPGRVLKGDEDFSKEPQFTQTIMLRNNRTIPFVIPRMQQIVRDSIWDALNIPIPPTAEEQSEIFTYSGEHIED